MPKKRTRSPKPKLPSSDFQAWVDATGSRLDAARKLDVPFSTLEAWYLRKTSPQLFIVPHILKVTRLTVVQLANSFWSEKRDPECRRRFDPAVAPKRAIARSTTRLIAKRIDK